MDSLTQGLLGATTFALVKEKEIGKKALLIGALAGTVPDLDVLLSPLFNEIEFLTVHRSVSHSLGFALLLSILLGELFHRIYKRKFKRWKWNLAFFLAIFTHALLDWFTTYGTKLISPLSDHLFSLNSIHVFDPMYSLILLSGVLIYLYRSFSGVQKPRIIPNVLIISTFYLLIGLASKNHAFYHFKSQAVADGIQYQDILVSPTPLNIFLWHGIVKTERGYHFGTYSIFDGKKGVSYQFEESDNSLISEMENNRLTSYYLDYSQGYPLIKTEKNGTVKVYAIKYGPINYYGKPEFVYPLIFNKNDLSENNIKIDYSGKQRGPVKNYKNLVRRILGVI